MTNASTAKVSESARASIEPAEQAEPTKQPEMICRKAPIEGVTFKQLVVIPDERGKLMEITRSDDGQFTEYGQHYLTTAYPGVVKAWHYHKEQDDNFCVIKGMAKVALLDRRKDSPSYGNWMEFFTGECNPMVIHIPREVLHGYKAIGTETVYLINMVTKPYNHIQPDEYRVKHDEYAYKWIGDING